MYLQLYGSLLTEPGVQAGRWELLRLDGRRKGHAIGWLWPRWPQPADRAGHGAQAKISDRNALGAMQLR